MTIYRGQIIDTPDDPFAGGSLRADADAGLLVRDGLIVERDAFSAVRAKHPQERIVDLRAGTLRTRPMNKPIYQPPLRVDE